MLEMATRTAPSPISTLTAPAWRLDALTCMAMLVIVPGKGSPAHETVFGVATWLYCVQQFSPITQLAPQTLVSGVAVAGLVAMQVVYVAASDV